MSDRIISAIRTAVPAAVGWLATWLATNFNIILSEDSTVSLVSASVALLTVAYYVLVRLLTRWFPSLEWLLGYPSHPVQVSANRRTIALAERNVKGIR